MHNIVPFRYHQLNNIVGIGFRPTDEELVRDYLIKKLQGNDTRVDVIPVIDLCGVEPSDVPEMLRDSPIRFNDPEWFFFSRVDYKYSNSKRVNRTTKSGYWKTTGKERDVRCTDTNRVIGTKKTLVYYIGRVPNGDKSNWVIHEYHDATFHESQRTFVLCRLIKKAEITAEGGTEAMILDEWEPSRSIVSDYENQAKAEGIPSEGTFTEIGTTIQEVHQTENCLYPIHQSPSGIGQEEAAVPKTASYNAYFENENTVMQTSFETTEEDNFLNSILADEENIYDFDNSFTQLESMKRVHSKSCDTGVEIIYKQDGDIMDNSIVCNEYLTSKRFKSSYNVVHGDTCLLSSNHEANQDKINSTLQDDLWGPEASSCDSTANEPLEINCIEISSSPSTSWRLENQYIQDQATSFDGYQVCSINGLMAINYY